jgi:hypothetical protein
MCGTARYRGLHVKPKNPQERSVSPIMRGKEREGLGLVLMIWLQQV